MSLAFLLNAEALFKQRIISQAEQRGLTKARNDRLKNQADYGREKTNHDQSKASLLKNR